MDRLLKPTWTRDDRNEEIFRALRDPPSLAAAAARDAISEYTRLAMRDDQEYRSWVAYMLFPRSDSPYSDLPLL